MIRRDSEVAAEALRRGKLIKARRKKTWEWLKAGVLITAFLGLIVCLVLLPGRYPGSGPPLPAQAGATILDGAAIGGYILMGIPAFALGAAVALLCLRKRKK